ncbi:hypothetical protein CEXT_22491 [Caerostris extrusa]|uniref:Uncharacterized protein n=1 Tax=Caerostris extrusa TaxID=172846 RepID=A0AAV4P4G9_CAEEX|nr:hypothetical protein CEXT_22491 [Caerostris extrusa]
MIQAIAYITFDIGIVTDARAFSTYSFSSFIAASKSDMKKIANSCEKDATRSNVLVKGLYLNVCRQDSDLSQNRQVCHQDSGILV